MLVYAKDTIKKVLNSYEYETKKENKIIEYFTWYWQELNYNLALRYTIIKFNLKKK